MNMNPKNPTAKPAGSPKSDAPQEFEKMVEKGAAQARDNFEKVGAATTEQANLLQTSYSTAIKGIAEYNSKMMEFAHANMKAAFDFFEQLSAVKSPTAFMELSTEHARKQLETLTEQAKQLASLAQTATLAAAEPIKAGVSKAFNHAA